MKKKIFLYIGISIVSISIVVSVSLILNDEDKKFNTLSLPELEFTYDDSNSKLKEKLEFFDISMSKPIKLINRNYLEEFCTFVVIEDLVCDCWNEVQPGDIETVAGWVDKQRDFHTSDTKPTSKSNLSLSGMQLQMELTTNTEGYLWKLLISG